MATTGATNAKPSSVKAILDALGQHPGATATGVAEAAGIGRSTAGKTLVHLETQGRVIRQRGTSQGGKVPPDRWTLTSATTTDEVEPVQPEQPATAEAPTPEGADTSQATAAVEQPTGQAEAISVSDSAEADTSAAATAPTSGDAQSGTGEATSSPRLRPGALRALVHDFLAERPGQEFTPTRIGKELGRSAGAVGNALATMTDAGEVTQTSTKPRKYMLAAQPSTTAETDAETAKAS